MNIRVVIFPIAIILFYSCSPSKQIARSAKKNVLDDPALLTAHVGISVYDPSTSRYLYNHQGDKYFVPASNTKLPTCYAAMKYLGDSLVGLRYGIPEDEGWRDRVVVIDFTGDPTLLHPDYRQQPAFDFLKQKFLSANKNPGFLYKNNRFYRWGSGWSWNDFQESYMAERSSFPIFGNVMHISLRDSTQRFRPHPEIIGIDIAQPFVTGVPYFDSLLNSSKTIFKSQFRLTSPPIRISRNIASNSFRIENSQSGFKEDEIPFVTNDYSTALRVISDTIKKQFALVEGPIMKGKYSWLSDDGDISEFHINKWNVVHSQKTDSLLKPMMHRSDNFFAEQTLLMVSNEMLGVMNDGKIIDSLLKTDFKDLPQKPRWADGSGLSRFNLFTPQDFVTILNKMKNEFGMKRIKEILPTGNEGTLEDLYKSEVGFIYAKTGTLSGVLALSGFLYTKKDKLLIFSILINNHQASASEVRRSMEKFVRELREKN